MTYFLICLGLAVLAAMVLHLKVRTKSVGDKSSDKESRQNSVSQRIPIC